MKEIMKKIIEVVIFLFIIGVIFSFLSGRSIETKPEIKHVGINLIAKEINEGNVKKIIVSGNKVKAILKDETVLISLKEPEEGITQTLKNLGVKTENLEDIEIELKESSQLGLWLGFVIPSLLPILLLVLFFWWSFKQAQKGAGQAFTFVKSHLKKFKPEKNRITFDDVANLKEAKEELQEVVEFLKHPQKFLEIGAKIPRGVLLVGPPGCGKTLLARAVAGTARVPFFHISGSEFIELFVGVGASVSGETPVLIRTKDYTRLMPIKEFVDQFYEKDEEGYRPLKEEVFTLGYKPLETKFGGASKNSSKKYFDKSCWQKVQGVYRHKVNEIYEIEYLGGKIKTTGDHSVFVREHNMIVPKKVSKLKVGEILVSLPFKVRSEFVKGKGTFHKIKSFQFPSRFSLELDLYEEKYQEILKLFNFALQNRFVLTQKEIGEKIGVSQTTVKDWQIGRRKPKFFTLNVFRKEIPSKIKVTPKLMRLFGYFLAEGRCLPYGIEFVFGVFEKELQKDCLKLMKEIFNLEGRVKETEDNTVRLSFSSKVISEFFEKHCGTGSKNKHLPEFVWDLPKEYVLELLKGWIKGDGYQSKEKKLIGTSTSYQLILEFKWLLAMHGIKTGIRKNITKEGRIIKNRPLPLTESWNLIIGKSANPFINYQGPKAQYKKPYIKKITKLPYNDFVYDLCGCENEAFFGGENPILLHNSRVRDAFQTAKEAARKEGAAILFIDEIDAIGRERGAGLGGGHDEREQTLNQILVEMDGFEKEDRLIVVAATNRPDILDPALLRPGRFDRRIVLDLPDLKGREEILKIHSRNIPLASDVDFKVIAERTPGFSGADLENLVNEAAIFAARKNKKIVSQEEFLAAIEKVLLGPERKSFLLSEKEKKIAAYHEAGHAIVSAFTPSSSKVQKISIIARGKAAGYTLRLPEEEKHFKTKTEFLADLATLLGGYTAEKLIFGEITTGASNDLREATDIARALVTKYGMSSLGPITFGKFSQPVFLGREIAVEKDYSDEIAAKIDKETKKFIDKAHKKAIEVLKKHRKLLDKIANLLIEKETIEKEEFEKLIEEEKKKIKKE